MNRKDNYFQIESKRDIDNKKTLEMVKQFKKEYKELMSLYDSRFVVDHLDKKSQHLSEKIEDLEYKLKKN